MSLNRGIMRFSVLMLVLFLGTGAVFGKSKGGPEPITFVVMDPLARELACACVKGYGQRDYRKLAARLDKAIKQRVNIEFSDDFAETLEGSAGRAATSPEVIVIGDRSVVVDGAK